MSSVGRTIARNAGFLMASQVITWAMALVSVVFVPRYLGAAGIGKYQLAASLWAIMAIFITFGMDTLLTKEISRDPDRVSELLTTSIVLRTTTFLASFVLIIVYARLVGYPQDTLNVIFLVGVSILIAQIGYTFRASLQGLERMEFIALSDIAGRTFVTILAIIFLLKGYSLLMIVSLEVGAALVSLAVLFFAMKKIHKLQFRFDRHLVGWMVKASLPYLMLSGFLVAYGQIDTIIISLLVSEKQIGWYSVALRLSGTFVFIPTVFMTALLPASSRMHKSDPEDLYRLMSKSFDLLLLVSIPIGIGVMILANPLVLLLYGLDFVNSGPILSLMGIVVIFLSINMFLSQFFISSDRQNVWVTVMAVATALTIPLDFILVPLCQKAFGIGAIGGAISFLVTEAGMVIFGLVMLPKGMVGWKNGWLVARVLMAGLAMAAVVWWVSGAFIVVPILSGIVVYALSILLLKVLSQEDWAMIRNVGLGVIKRLGWYKPQPPIIRESIDIP